MRKPLRSRRSVLRAMGCCAGAGLFLRHAAAGAASLAPAPVAPYSPRAVALVESTHVIDMLCNIIEARVIKGGPNTPDLVFERMSRWNRDPATVNDANLRRYRESGINTFLCSPEIKAYYPKDPPYERAVKFLQGWNRLIERRPDVFLPIRDGAALAAAPEFAKLAVILGIQNGDHFRTPDDVETLYGMGLRLSQLTYNAENPLGGGAFTDIGLKPFGAEIIRAMNRTGMVVDLAHASNRLAYDAARETAITPIISHTNCQALTPGFVRNASDPVIKAVAAKGGVVGLTVLRQFVSLKEPTTIRDFVRHIDHIVDLVGIEHVGLGSDNDLVPFDGIDDEAKRKYFSQPAQAGYQWRERAGIDGLDHHRRVYDIVEAMLKRGYSDQHIRMFLGGNFLRVLTSIWATRAVPAAASVAAAPDAAAAA